MAKRLLVAIDGSDTGNRALEQAAELSNKLGRGLSIIHVQLHGRPSAEMLKLAEVEHLVDQSDTKEYFERLQFPQDVREYIPSAAQELQRAKATIAIGENILEEAKRRAEELGAQDVITRVGIGDYADEILEVAEHDDTDMIVMGRRGLGRVREALLGSVTQKVLHHSDRTVVIVQ